MVVLRLCRPYRAQTKGKMVESGVKYARRNMWPSMRFTDSADLNWQALEWCNSVANRRVAWDDTATAGGPCWSWSDCTYCPCRKGPG